MNNKSGIYIIRSVINDKVYIGSATSLYHRFAAHKSALLKNNHSNIHMQRFVNKHGFETLFFEVLEIVLDKNKLIEREQFWIDSYKFSNLFNICKMAGSNLGSVMSERTKKLISASLIGNTRSLGYKHSKSQRKAKSKMLMGNTRNLGKKYSEERKNKKRKLVFIYKDGVLIDKILGTKIVAEKYNVYATNVSATCLGKVKSTGGYQMEYGSKL